MSKLDERLRDVTRRHFFKQAGFGIGAMALASLLDDKLLAAVPRVDDNVAPRGPHFAPKAKRVIYLFMAGGPSQLDLFDYKPALVKYDGQDIPQEFNHAPAQILMNTGHQIIGRPSLGAWLMYGLGSGNRDLPGFVVLLSGENNPDGGKSCWGSGFLPTVYQGVEFRSKGEPVLFLTNPEGVTPEERRRSIEVLKDMNEAHLKSAGDPEIVTRIAACEMAY